MSTLAVTNALASVFVPIGMTGAAIALVCALIAGVALSRGAAGLAGGAIGVWIVGALLSLASSFAHVWMPVISALGALGAALIVGPALRALISRVAIARGAAPSVRAPLSAAAPAGEPRPQAQRAPAPISVPASPPRPSAPVTEGVGAAA